MLCRKGSIAKGRYRTGALLLLGSGCSTHQSPESFEIWLAVILVASIAIAFGISSLRRD